MNGTSEGFFKSSLGLRQGDPLFLLLFIFVMEALNKMIFGVVKGGFISGFSVGETIIGLIHISHLLFANDTLIFCEANTAQIWALSALLLCFEAVLGLKVNLAKSKVVPVGDIINVESLASTLRCKILQLPIKYLDPSFGGYIQIDIYLE